MARVTVEDCLDRVPSRFALVMLVAKRAKQILKGDTPTVNSKENKAVVTSLREVANGNVSFDIASQNDLIVEAEKDLRKLAPTGDALDAEDLDA